MRQAYVSAGTPTAGFPTASNPFARGGPAAHDGGVRTIEQVHGTYVLSTDRERVDAIAVHRFLSGESYWARGRPFDVQVAAIANSALVVGAYDPSGAQVGFARMVSDLATFAWLCDVYVLAAHRGGGVGTAMVRLIVEHPDVAGVRLQLLATADAHELYAKFGYAALDEPRRWMVRRPATA
jgi:GNAT superfamily N-acetyltransferase